MTTNELMTAWLDRCERERIKPRTGVFMLRNLKSPETYFQTAFRVQSPWEITDEAGNKTIMKQECYVFDFALDRALRQISDYSCRLDVNESNPEKKVAEFIGFLPVLAYDGSTMRQINAQDVLDIAMAGTSATLLAKRWESALLVNVDNDTLSRLLANKEALDALEHIEGFRSLNNDIQTIINKSEAVKKEKRRRRKTHATGKEGAFRRRKRIQIQAQADSGETHQIRNARAGIHVSDRLQRAVAPRCNHAAGTRAFQKGNGTGCKRL